MSQTQRIHAQEPSRALSQVQGYLCEDWHRSRHRRACVAFRCVRQRRSLKLDSTDSETMREAQSPTRFGFRNGPGQSSRILAGLLFPEEIISSHMPYFSRSQRKKTSVSNRNILFSRIQFFLAKSLSRYTLRSSHSLEHPYSPRVPTTFTIGLVLKPSPCSISSGAPTYSNQ